MEDNHLEPENKPETPVESRPGFRSVITRPITLIGLTVLTAAIICIAISLFLISSPATTNNPDKFSSKPSAVSNSTPQFEEVQEGNLDDLVKKADLALLKTLEETGVSINKLQLEDVSIKQYKGRDYHYQQLRFPIASKRAAFIATVRKKLALINANATLTETSSDSLSLSINGIETHKIFMDKPKEKQRVPSAKSPKMAIVIDDMGEDLRFASELAKTGLKITFSIWPSSSHVKQVAEIAKRNGNEILVHMPMEPHGYPKVAPGADALLVGMRHNRIVNSVNQAIKKVPGSTGLNNHMGSRFTEDIQGMKAVMQALKQHHFFFLDSRTTPKSVCRKASAENGVTLYERNIFLDNVKDVSAIEFQLKKAEKIALKRGQSIAIGHPHHQTLEAIKRWAAQKDKRLYLVFVNKLKPQK